MSMRRIRIQIQIEIQGFDDQKLTKKNTAGKNYFFCDQKLKLWVIFALLDLDPDPADHNQYGSMRIRIRNTGYFFFTSLLTWFL
jgi:hypothetical protein